MIELNPPETPYPSIVRGRASAGTITSRPAFIPARPIQVVARRPNLRVSAGSSSPATIVPTAMAVPCRPATVAGTRRSARSSGRAALRPYM